MNKAIGGEGNSSGFLKESARGYYYTNKVGVLMANISHPECVAIHFLSLSPISLNLIRAKNRSI